MTHCKVEENTPKELVTLHVLRKKVQEELSHVLREKRKVGIHRAINFLWTALLIYLMLRH